MLKKGSTSLSKKLFILTLGGGVVFWVTTIAISLLPIAAEYRSVFSKASIQTVWVASLPAGLIIGILLDAPRFLFLGIAIGYLYRWLCKGSDPSVNTFKSSQAR